MGKLKLNNGNTYIVTLQNRHTFEGELQNLEYRGEELYSLWRDMGNEPVSVSFGDTKEIKLKKMK